MIVIEVPNNNIEERRYILDILLGEFLGLNYSLKVVDSLDSWIIDINGAKLEIEDTFFNRFPKDLEYLKLENIPKSIEELDIFAASFFMLTRWEEYVNPVRDNHHRFPARESLAFKQGFLNRPIVNEYVAWLKQRLLELDSSLSLQKREFELILTHDVDEIYFWRSWRQLLRIVVGDILKRGSLSLAIQRINEFFSIKWGKRKDPYDTFDWLMDRSEVRGVKSRFYFMSGGVTAYDNRYNIDDSKVVALIKRIKERGHIIGIHPSYNAYSDAKLLKREKELLEEVCKCPILEGREHYLRFEVPTTWQIWEENGMKVDSTCGYADREGFRCGTGDAFSVFNILTRKKLHLKERPLIYMDDNRAKGERIYDKEELIATIRHLIKQCREYESSCTLLFHQNIFASKEVAYKEIYEAVIE